MKRLAGPPPLLIAGFLDRIARRSSIRRTLVVVLVFTLAPLMLFAFIQGGVRLAAERKQLAAALARTALQAATIETIGFDQLHDGLKLLAADEAVATGSSTTCRDLFNVTEAMFANLASIRSEADTGELLCGSSVPFGVNAITLSAPWRHAGQSGRIVARFDLAAYRAALARRHASRDETIVIATQDGSILAQSRSLPWQRFPALAETGVVTGRAGDSRQWSITQQPLQIPGLNMPALRVVAVQRDYGLFGPRPGVLISLFVVPLLAILISSLALWIATNWMLLRWIDRLRDAAVRIGGGQHRLNIRKFADAPDEIRSLASSMQKMARAMAQHGAGLRDALAQQRLMSLELHHRVKNNLQIVSSYLALRAGDGNEQRPLANAQLRVAALSLVHRLLYDKGEIMDIEAPVLITELGRLISSHHGTAWQRPIDVAIDKGASLARMDIDTATTTTLLLVELTDRLVDGQAVVIAARGIDKRLELIISWEGGASPESVAENGLVAGFGRQLGGSIITGSEPPSLRINFEPLRAFHPALPDRPQPPLRLQREQTSR